MVNVHVHFHMHACEPKHKVGTGKQGFLYGGKPHQNPSSTESLGCSLHYTLGRKYQLFCCNRVGLPTTAITKEREGKLGYCKQPKIDTIYKNQAPHLIQVYKNIVYTQS